MSVRIKLGVSACLLGNKVRFDGQHKQQRYITDVLAQHFDLVSVCPEVSVGLSVPRPALRLVVSNGRSRLAASKPGDEISESLTDAMRDLADSFVQQSGSVISGFIFKKDSPSCGVFKVKQYDHNNVPNRHGQGVFAQRMAELMPALPVEEEGRLNDEHLRRNFIDKVLMYSEFMQLTQRDYSLHDLISFHASHKLTIMSRSPAAYRTLGQFVAGLRKSDYKSKQQEYIRLLMKGMSNFPTRGKHANVLYHIMGYIKKQLGQDDKKELGELIEKFRTGLVPIDAPISMLRHYFRLYKNDYIDDQSYIKPKEMYYIDS